MDCGLPGYSVHGIHQARLWSGLPFPSAGDLLDPGIKPRSPAFRADSSPSESPGNHCTNTLIVELKFTMSKFTEVNNFTVVTWKYPYSSETNSEVIRGKGPWCIQVLQVLLFLQHLKKEKLEQEIDTDVAYERKACNKTHYPDDCVLFKIYLDSVSLKLKRLTNMHIICKNPTKESKDEAISRNLEFVILSEIIQKSRNIVWHPLYVISKKT